MAVDAAERNFLDLAASEGRGELEAVLPFDLEARRVRRLLAVLDRGQGQNWDLGGKSSLQVLQARIVL